MASIDLHLTRAESGIPTIIWIEEAAEAPDSSTAKQAQRSMYITEAGALLDTLMHSLPVGTLNELGKAMVARGLIVP